MIPYYIDITSDPDIETLARRVPRLMKFAFERTAMYWHKKMLPRHFERKAKRKYHYQPRRRRYQHRKQAFAKRDRKIQKGGRSPIVYSGLTEALAEGRGVIRAYPTRVRLRMPSPRYVTPRPKDPSKPNLHDEILRVMPGENRTLTRVFRDNFNLGVASFARVKKVRRLR